MSDGASSFWKRERLGLSLIAASLVVIAIITLLLFDYLRDAQTQRVRSQGISLMRVMAALPYSELVPKSNPAAVLQTLKVNQSTGDFAYATVTRLDGTTIAEVAKDGVLVPTVIPGSSPSSWLGERAFAAQDSGRGYIEFYAPLLDGAEIAGHLRLGYFQTKIGLTATQIPFAATLALVVFLLTPMFYFLMRRELKPLASVQESLNHLMESGSLQTVKIDTSSEFGEFVDKFNRFIDFANQRVHQVEDEQQRILTSNKLLSYRKDRILRALESLPDAILLLDEDGKVTVANQHVESVFGVDPKDVVASSDYAWCTQTHVRDYFGQCRVGQRGGLLPDPLEIQSEITADRSYSITPYPLFNSDSNKTVGCLVVIRDITVETLARRGRAEFVAHVAHEFKTPLNTLSMYSQVLQTAHDDEEMRIDAANTIEDEVSRMSLLINNMLNITRIETGSLDIDAQRVRIRDLLEDVFANIKHDRAAKNLEFELDLPTEITALSLDKDLMRIALNNLLTNATKYNRPGGKVTLSAKEYDDTIEISVVDTGVGIAEKDMPLIFGKFYRSQHENIQACGGHGLGLALAKEIVELHDGNIHVASAVGEGTEFTIRLWKNVHAMKQVG